MDDEKVPAVTPIDTIEKLDRFEAAINGALAEQNFFSRAGMTHGLLEYVPSLVALARKQLTAREQG